MPNKSLKNFAGRARGAPLSADVRQLIAVFNDTQPLSRAERSRLHRAYEESNRVDWMASEAVQQEQIQAIQERQRQYQESSAYKLWEESLSRDRANDLGLHAQLIRELFLRFLDTGEVPPPASAWRIAVILRKRKELELERAFLAAWCRHFGDVRGTRYEQLSKRFQKLSPPT